MEEKRINSGYEIIESHTIGSNELVIGHNPEQFQQLKRYWHLPCIKNQIEYLGQNTLR